jgi:hypothetical protein
LVVPLQRQSQPLIGFCFEIRKLPETSPSPEWVSPLELGTVFNQTMEAATKFVKFYVSSDFIKKIHYFAPNFSFASEFLILTEIKNSPRKRRAMEPFCEPVGLYGKAVVPSFVAI